MTGVVAESLGVGPAHLDGLGIQVSRHPNIFPASPAASLNGPGKQTELLHRLCQQVAGGHEGLYSAPVEAIQRPLLYKWNTCCRLAVAVEPTICV